MSSAVQLVEQAVALLVSIDVSRLAPAEAMRLAVAARRAEAAASGLELAALGRVHEAYPSEGLPGDCGAVEGRRRAAVHEVQAGYGCYPNTAARRVGEALDYAGLPGTLAALRAGRLETRLGWVLKERTLGLSAAARAAVEQRVLARHAGTPGGLTQRQFGELVARAVIAADPGLAERRAAEAVAHREVRHERSGCAGGRVELVGPVHRTGAAWAAVDAEARARRRAGAAGTLDQLRFDVAVERLLGQPAEHHSNRDNSSGDNSTGDGAGAGAGDGDRDGAGRDGEPPAAKEPAAPPAGQPASAGVSVVLHVTLPLSALLGVDDAPGVLQGVGAIPASFARELAAAATEWRRILTDPVDGQVVVQQIRRYRPTPAMRRFVFARHGGVCADRGCSATRGLQDDHVRPHARAGVTVAVGLSPLCQRAHNGKTHQRWVHALDAVTGALTQTSPLGLSYTTRPLEPPGPTGRRAGPLDARDVARWVAEDPADTAAAPAVEPPDLDERDLDHDPWPGLRARLAAEREAHALDGWLLDEHRLTLVPDPACEVQLPEPDRALIARLLAERDNDDYLDHELDQARADAHADWLAMQLAGLAG